MELLELYLINTYNAINILVMTDNHPKCNYSKDSKNVASTTKKVWKLVLIFFNN